VTFNQGVFSGRKIIPQTSKPGSDTNMVSGQICMAAAFVFLNVFRFVCIILIWIERVIDLHERDCEEGYDGVFLYGLLEKKYKNASRELIWQWFFPAMELTFVPIRVYLWFNFFL
jgi:hypothetical protein